MVLYNGGANKHEPTPELRQRIKDLAVAGIPLYLISDVVDLDEDTVKKHYERELNTAEPEMIEKVAKTVVAQALKGNEKSQALYLKTKGAKYGWVEKQVIENQNSDDTKELKQQIAALEDKYKRDY